MSAAAMPDVCFTPPEGVPPSPTGVPIPYPNTGMASDTTNGTRTVKIAGDEVGQKNKSYFKKSMGDEAGCASKKGIVTSTNTGKVYYTMWSMDVKVENQNVVRAMDLMTHNHMSPMPGNTPPWPYVDAISFDMITPLEPVGVTEPQEDESATGQSDEKPSRAKTRKQAAAEVDKYFGAGGG